MPDMKLVSMKQSKRAAEESMPSAGLDERPAYPYGLEVRLEEDAIEKLKLDDLPDAGETMMIVARVAVTHVSMNESAGDKAPRRSLTLQITDLAVGADEDSDKPKAQDVLYKG